MKEHDSVVLTCGLDEYGLVAGDVGTIVHIHDQALAYEVEFMTLNGQTLAVVTLRDDQIRPIAQREIPHARVVA